MSDFTVGGIKFDSSKVFPKKGTKRADDVAKIYRKAIEIGVKEGADHFVASNINKDENGKDNIFTDERGNTFKINNGTQQEAINKLNNDKTFPYILEKDSKKKGGSRLGYIIREKTAEELGKAKATPKSAKPKAQPKDKENKDTQ